MDRTDGIEICPFNLERDKEAALRIYREVGWLEKGKEEAALAHFRASHGIVAALRGEAESLATCAPGTLRYLEEDLPASFITGVTTSRIARKQGFASQLTARVVAQDAAEGALVSLLGMFEQGYYDQLGFGTLGYGHRVSFAPTQLRVPGRARIPIRLSTDDWERVHANRLERRRVHGGVAITPPEMTHGEMLWGDNAFGLGYADSTGRLTHHLWATGKEEHGPYRVGWMACRTREEFHELLLLLRELGDQVHSVRLAEPFGVQFQDLLEKPFALQEVTRGSKHESAVRAYAEYQARILDLPGCLERTRLPGAGTVRFRLSLSDPIGKLLPENTPWRGVAGEYVVTLGPESSAELGTGKGLPVLKASVNAFTRLWLGVRPATSLSWTDDLAGPPDLLTDLDRVLRLPDPKPDWDF
jgi:hypothetical protein